MNEAIGWFFWSIVGISGAILVYSAIAESIVDWRWKRALKRGEIKQWEPPKAEYLAAPRMH